MLRIFLIALLLFPAMGAADIFIREGSDTWGKRIAARWGVPGFGRSIAVIVAIGDYNGGWAPLEAPEYDAARMYDFLKNEAEFDIIYKFIDEEVTYGDLRRLMEETLPATTGPNDRLLFYFSGHGTQRQMFGNRVKGYLPLQHSKIDGWASMLSMDHIEDWWEAIAHTKQSLFILDACFSGLGLQSKGADLQQRAADELYRRGHHLITAGTADQESYASLSRWGGSLFTSAIIDAVRGAADDPAGNVPRDGIVSMKELWDYVDKRVRAETPPSAMNPQLASFEFNSPGEFFFLNSNYDPTAALGDHSGEAQSKGIVPTNPTTPPSVQFEDFPASQIRNGQLRLQALGYQVGPADGILGPNTRSAIENFQDHNGLESTGAFDGPTIRMLMSEDAKAAPRSASSAQARTDSISESYRRDNSSDSNARGSRYIDDNGCLREPNGAFVPGFRIDCR